MATKVSKIAIKKPSGEIKTAPIGKAHDDLHTSGKRGFVLNNGKFVGREEGAKVAKAAKQTTTKSPRLHSHNLIKGKK